MKDESVELLRQTDICIAPVYSLDEVLINPPVLHRTLVVKLDPPKLGKVRQIGILIKLSETAWEIRSIGARPGEHTDQMLAGLGYNK